MDDELAAIRAKRMAELQGTDSSDEKEGGNPEAAKQQQAQVEAQKDMKNSILASFLDQNARARLNTIAIAKPERAQEIENMIIRMAQTGQIQSKLDETQLKSLLVKINEQSQLQKSSKVKYDRRRAALDSDEDD